MQVSPRIVTDMSTCNEGAFEIRNYCPKKSCLFTLVCLWGGEMSF